MRDDLQAIGKERGIRYFLISFVDLFGGLRAKLVPASAIGAMQKAGAGFAGFATHLDLSPAHPDVFAVPDAESLIQLPWNKEVGWLASALWMDGQRLEQDPRRLLQDQIARAEAKGLRMRTGVECEFFLLRTDAESIADAADQTPKPCYDQLSLMRQYNVLRQISEAMLELGWGAYQTDHEDANGQFEMNWTYDDCLVTADRHSFFKYMVKSIAESHGLRATFMPKPFAHLTGNGCHVHCSVWSKDGQTNLFEDATGELGMSSLAYRFLGGVMHSAGELCAIFSPTVNSYKRINAPITASGATWSPNTVTYSGNNRTHMVRVPEAGRFEFRLMDGSAHPYLMQAALLAAGLDGIEHDRDPGDRLDIDMYALGHAYPNVKRLPLNLLDAIRLFDQGEVLREAFGASFIESYVKLKMVEWQSFMSHPTAWERARTLDC
jgi:glutamine synthetase